MSSQDGMSSPELASEPSRLSMPREWGFNNQGNTNSSDNGSGGREHQLELDGEWFGDAREATATEKVRICFGTDLYY